ncbi:D-methionine transport system ATP-binding protein [Halopolyspora algeriensis]|uniref:D-methionine transport system ATP-binding protein n=1 Tax=Halopolyspora algeriensis TaxID=1500506 RepID=A0A368VLN9_9ACTN|nr:methionine ABC transporter ATP-binding protein [Halopolyspora algeriensis]RCW39935.1 D-methionine transport system ATP-binding protein [Halopolyspora algeriensis]TQM46628.1 D-methionine transport system ATP-binding protein [Halopolyspora algeriensis]
MITVENLTKSFPHDNGAVVALDNVSMQVPDGAVCGVVGSSGAGKSTLARCIALLDKPDSGAIRVDGTDLVALDGKSLRAARRRIGVVPQGDSLLRQRTAAGNVALPLEAANMSAPQRRSRVAELLDLVGLSDKAPVYPDQLSGGQRQRVAVARALAAQPSVLLADEPTSALDPSTTDSVLTVLDRARSELGVTVLVVTHDMAVVRRIADDVAVLEQGSVVEHGKVLDLVSEPGSRIGSTLLPETDQGSAVPAAGIGHDVVAEVVLVGFAAVGALLPEASNRFDVELSILGGGLTRLGDTPVAKFRIGLSGELSESALKWMIEHDAHVRRAPVSVDGVAA